MRRLTADERKSMKDMVCYPEWQTFLHLINDFKDEFNSTEDIDEKASIKNIASEVIGRKLFSKKFDEFLGLIDIETLKDKDEVDKTYE